MPAMNHTVVNQYLSWPAIAGALLAFVFCAAPAEAQANRTYVSGNGTDSGICAQGAPCRTFAFALSQTNAGGEIDVLDPAGYGPVTITKAISIVDAGIGGIGHGVKSGNAITIAAGASDTVHLRGLSINGFGTGANGIQFTSGGTLEIENCDIRNFTGNGINIAPTGSTSVTGVFKNVIISNNANGLIVNGAGSTASGFPGIKFIFFDSVASDNSVAGITSTTVPGHAFPIVIVVNSVVSNNGTGLLANGGSFTVNLSEVDENITGLNVLGIGGTISTYGNNSIDGNLLNNLAFLIPILLH